MGYELIPTFQSQGWSKSGLYTMLRQTDARRER